jgi:A/G-specific adenine glycosylase
MMELGATVCTPKSPLCDECPIAEWCRARELGIVEKFPAKRVKRPTVEVTLAAAVLLNPRGQTLLVRPTSEDGALFSRLWQFPAIESTEDPPSDLARYLQRKFQIETNGNLKALRAARHAVTFRNVRLVPFVFQMPHLPKIERARTPMLNRLGSLPISNATRKIACAALDHCRRMPGGLSRK